MAKFKGQLEDAQLHNKSSDPSNLPDGLIWLNTTSSKPKVVIGGSAKNIATEDYLTAGVVSNTPSGNLSANTVQGALNELQGDIDTLDSGKASTSALTAHLDDATDAHDAYAISCDPFGNLASTDVQSALYELQIDINTLNTHASNTSNPHSVTASQVGNTTAQWNANKLQGIDISSTTPTANQVLKYNGTQWEPGTGGGGGGLNYIQANPDAEAGTTGWATYDDGTTETPVDGTGGSVSGLTWTRSTSTPLRGTGSFLFDKTGINNQGDGVSYAFTIDSADKARVMQIAFDYEPISQYQDGRIRVYVYDVTNSVLIEPTNRDIKNASIASKHTSTFQTASNSTSYRLIFHCATNTSEVFSVRFDNISVGPQSTTTGAFVSDWISYTPSISHNSGGITNYTATGRYRRVGDSMEVAGTITFSGASAAFSALYATIPSGFSIDTAKLPTTATASILGYADHIDAGVGYYGTGAVIYSGTTGFEIRHHQSAGSGSASTLQGTSNTSPFTFGSGDTINWRLTVPISGWSSGVTYSTDSYDGRIVGFRARNATATLTSSFSKVTFSTTDRDDVGGYSSGTYTVKVAGWYHVCAGIAYTRSATVAGNACQIAIYKGGSSDIVKIIRDFGTDGQSRTIDISDRIYCTAGTTLEIYAAIEGTSPAILSGTGLNYFSVQLAQGPSAIASGETVAVRATSTAGQAVSGSWGDVVFGTVTYSTHGTGSYSSSTGIYTAQAAEKVRVSALVTTASVSLTTSQFIAAKIVKSGSDYAINQTNGVGASNVYGVIVSDELDLVAGDTVKIQAFCSAATTLNTSAARNNFSVTRVSR